MTKWGFFYWLFMVVVKRRRGRDFFSPNFPWKRWKITDTLSWQDLISTLQVKLWTGKPKHTKNGQPLTWVPCDKCRRLQQRNQLAPVVKMSLFCMCIKRWPQHRRLSSQVSMHNIGCAFQITKTKAEGGDPNYIKFVTTSPAQTEWELKSLYSNNVIWEFKQTVEGQRAYGFI